MKSNSFREHLIEEMESIRTIDCHAHTYSPEVYYRDGPYDVFTLLASFRRQLVDSSGLTDNELGQILRNAPKGVPVGKILAEHIFGSNGWETFKRILSGTRNISFWRHNMVVYKHLFNFQDEELSDSNWQELNEKIKKCTADPEWYDKVTRICNLETQIKEVRWFEEWKSEYFNGSVWMQLAMDLIKPFPRKSLENYLGDDFTGLESLKDGVREVTEKYKKKNAVAIKIAHGYGRTLASEKIPFKKASSIYKRALKEEKLTPQEIKDFQDHMIYYLADLAGETELVFQIHTGLVETWGNIANGNPLHLIPLIRSHPSTKFDLTHMGYPYSREMGMLGKHYPNVYLNMAWAYLITMEGSRQSLNEWIDLVPGDRILGFGSDVYYPEMVYGHLVMARSCIADVLSEKAERDFISKEVAIDLAHKMMRQNAIELYSL